MKRNALVKVCVLLVSFFSLGSQLLFPAYAEVMGPGWFDQKGTPVTHGQAQSYFAAAKAKGQESSDPSLIVSSSLVTIAAATTITPEISALARALQNDPKLIYEYVHNHIDYVPYFGSLKGATLTLLDRSGNDFDQASLMIALLRASGFTAQYIYGQIAIPNFGPANEKNMQSWLGVDPNTGIISSVLAGGGIPFVPAGSTTLMDRVWVKATVGGSDYLFDPALKAYQTTLGMNLKTAMGYNRTTLLTAAGGTLGTDSIQNLNTTGLNNQLATYSSNLVSFLRANTPNAAMEEIIGGREIVPEFLTALPTSLPFSSITNETWIEIPNVYVHTVRIQHGGIDQILDIPDIAARKLAITYNTGASVATVQTASLAASGSTEPVITSTKFAPEPAPATVQVTDLQAPTPESFALDLPVREIALPEISASSAELTAATSELVLTTQALQPVLDFGRVTPAFTSWYSVTIPVSNASTNTVNLIVTTQLLSNASGAYRFLSGGGSFTLAPGQSRNVTIEFNGSGQSRGTKTATFRLIQDYSGFGTYTDDWPLTGFVADAPSTSLSGYTGVTAFLNEPKDQTVNLHNNGSYTLSIDSTMTLTGANLDKFQLISGVGAGSIAAGSLRAINWRYLANVRGTHTASIQVSYTYDGISGYQTSLSLQGQTVLKPDFTGSLGVNFGQRYLNDPTNVTATLKNSGTLNLTINSIARAGTDPARFQLLSGTASGTLSPGQTRNLDVQYLADVIGTHSALIRVNYTYDGQTNTVDLPLAGDTVSAPAAQLWLDNTLIAQEIAPISGTGLAKMTLTIDHPYAAESGTYSDQTSDYNLTRGSTYVILSEFGGSRDGVLLKQRQRLLEELRASGLADTSREVLTETLNVMGQTWMRQTTLSGNLLGELSDVINISHHRFGIMAQETSYYIDIKTQISSTVSRQGVIVDQNASFRASGFLGSALEHGVLEQVQGSNRPAVSTIRLMDLANTNGDKIFKADSTNWSIVQPQLTGYSATDLTEFGARVTAGAILFLPANGQIVFNQWSGKGYVDFQEKADGSASVGMIIGGDLFGGYLTVPGSANPFTAIVESQREQQQTVQVDTNAVADPVDIATGAFLVDQQDLTLGGTEPWGLSFSRAYRSDNRLEKRTMGYGWTHNYDAELSIHSDVAAGLGLRAPIDAAAMLVASTVTLDLMSPTIPDVKDWTTSVLVGQWSMGQLFENAVSGQLQSKALTYIKLPDGTYNPPPSVTTNLVKNAGLFELRERFGNVITFDANNKISGWTDVDGNSMTFAYTANKLSKVTDNVGRTLTLGYTGEQLTSVTDSTGRSLAFAYTGDDLTQVTDVAGQPWRYAYDTGHRITTATDPRPVTFVTNRYDNLGRMQEQDMPLQGGGIGTNKFYLSGFRNVEEDPAGNQTVYFFDRTVRTVAVENALNNTATQIFDGQGHTIQSTDPLGNATVFAYDGNQNLEKVTNALLEETNNTYDGQQRLTDVTDALAHTTQFAYDAKHHLTQTTDAVSNTTSATYNTLGQTATSTDGRTTVTTLTYDALGTPATSKTAAHPAVTTVYDNRGQLQSLTDQEGATTSFTYDNRGLVTKITDPLLRDVNLVYDNAGLLSTRTDRNTATIAYTYTPAGNPDTITYPDTSSVQFSYDNRENLTGMTDPLGSSTYSYDALKRLTSQTDPNNLTVGYGYNEAGNLTSITYPSNKTVNYTYDALNRIKTVTTWLGDTVSYTYDAAGRLTDINQLNGSITQYSYDNSDRLTSLVNKKSDNTVLSSHGYVLDGNGNRTQEVREEPQLPRNLAVATTNYTYNTQRNRLLNTNTDTFLYDNEGQQTDKNGTTHSFDYEHRLISAGTDQYQYDGVGNRLRATRGGVTTKYLYDASGNLLAEADNAGTITRYYIYGATLLGAVEGTSTYTYHFDGTGHTVAITNASQTIVNKYAYTPYGILTDETETISQPFKFVGQFGVMTEPNGLYYMRARYYDPSIQRFITQDPIGLDGGVNLYAYVGGNPINVIDPSGLEGVGVSSGFTLWDALSLVGGAGLVAFDILNTPASPGPDVGLIGAGILATKGPKAVQAAKASITGIKNALREVYKYVGKLPKGKAGKFGSPQRGDARKGYRLDPPHARAPKGSPDSKPHVNWWDYTKGKRGSGGRSGSVPIE